MSDIDHVQAVLQRPPSYDAPAADPAAIRARGLRIRRRRRTRAGVLAGSALAVAALVASNVATGVEPAHQAPASSDPSTFVRRVLDAVPGSYVVDHVVVIPAEAKGSLGASGPSAPVVSPDRIASPVVPLGFGLTRGLNEIPSAQSYPAFLDHVPDDVDLRVATGPASIACVRPIDVDGCTPTILGTTTSGTPYVIDQLGNGVFPSRAADLEVRTGNDFTEADGLVQTMIGGLPRADVARVEVRLSDSRRVLAQVDHAVAPGSTVFWTHSTADVVAVRAYDAQGTLVARLRDLPACTADPCGAQAVDGF